MSVNTGKYQTEKGEGDDTNEIGYRQSRENDAVDSKYGFDRVRDTQERTGYLINMHSTEILDEDRRLVSALDMYFIKMDGSRYKATVVVKPYFYVKTLEKHLLEVSRFLSKKYAGQISKIEPIEKEDLDLPNHLSGIKQTYLQLWFPNNTALIKVRREIMAAVRKNKEREKANTFYVQMLSSTLSGNNASSSFKQIDQLDSILDVREHDVPYHIRVSIDLKIFCGSWYSVRCRGGTEPPVITARPDIIERPEPIVLAFDIETTKLPLKFPDAQTDQIMMISYMIDGQGYLITNREIISSDVEDFEYTPKPEFEGNFVIFNEQNEMSLLQKFFDHIMDVKPHIFVTYNGDFFDWPFVETRAAVHDLDMKREIGFSKSRQGVYLCRPAMHMDCLCWVKRDSYLPVGSQGLKAVAKAKLRYDPVELDPEDMCRLAVEDPQVLSNYSVSDAVATYYLYMKYVNPFIFALCTIIPLEPDEILRKGSGTLCESLLMVEAFHASIIYPNKEQTELNKLTADGHVLDTETYVGGHVEALESGVFRADIPCRFRLDPKAFSELIDGVGKTLAHAIETEEGVPLSDVINLEEVSEAIISKLMSLRDAPNRLEQPVIYHLDVGAMYPNIILTNRLQPSAMVTEEMCAACDFNKTCAPCKRDMEWMWRGEFLPAGRSEFQRIQQQLETERFPSLFPGGPPRAFHELSKEDQASYEKKRLSDYCRKAYKKTKVTRLETRTSTVCQMENSFYVDTVRAFRDRRYEYKGLTKSAKAQVAAAVASGDAVEVKAAKGREVLYDSLQLAHKCILNSFYGYVMRRGARWHSMEMAGIVCLTGSNIIRKAREIVERVGRPLELDTDGIWCVLPASFPENFIVHTNHVKKKKITVSYINSVLNAMVKDHFTNDQYHELEKAPGADNTGSEPVYSRRSENSIFFEVDGPYLAMVLPAAKEEGKKLKKRYAVFNFDGSLAELKGFEVKRRGELQLIKIFQSSVFESFLHGSTLEECYESVAKVADYWLDVLYSKGSNMPDSELFELISENRSMSRKLEDYGAQKSTSISTAKRLAEFLGDQMVKDAGLACKFIISRKPDGAPVTERAIPLAIFQSEPSVRRHYLRKWLRDNTMGDADIRDVLDWNYYIERLGGTVQKIITIPAALQGLANPVPRIQHPDWLHRRMLEKNDVLKQRRISEIFAIQPRPEVPLASERSEEENMLDIEDIAGSASISLGVPIATKRKRQLSTLPDTPASSSNQTWREALGQPPPFGTTKDERVEWVMFQKKKWAWQASQRGTRNNQKEKRLKNSNAPIQSTSVARQSVTLGGFLRKAQKNLIDSSWQIIQIGNTTEPGLYRLWVLVGNDLHQIKLTVPRIFYVNQRASAPSQDDAMWKKVHRVLPRSRPLHNLYQYSVSERVFRENSLGLLADLATPDIEGIYETQMSLEFRALMDLGCVCSVERGEARRIATSGSKEADSFSLQQLEFRTVSHQRYLPNCGGLKKAYLYQHSAPTGKKEMWGLFLTASKRALIIVQDTVRTNQMPNMNSLFTVEKLAKLSSNDDIKEESLPPNDIIFEVRVETDPRQVYRLIQRALSVYKEEKRGPTLLAVQSPIGLMKLNTLMPGMTEFPQTQIHIVDTASLLAGLDWQRVGARAMIRHYLNLNKVIELMLEQCRYFHVPLGNMPADPVLFGADLFFARHLQKHNFVLWCSPTGRPDLGGREADDSRLLAEFEDSMTAVRCKPGFYSSVCVELSVDSLAVSALLQASRVHEIEGASTAVTFDTIPQASLEEMVGGTNLAPLPSYDETALCSAAFKVMRSMVNNWLREVSLYRNVFADFQVVHFYRWVRSSGALLYDPALRRALNTLMKKLFLQLVAEFQRLGADIIYADFNRIILSTGKKTVADAIGYVEFVVQSIRNKELFHSIDLSYQQCWNFLLWLDTANFAGIQGKLPRELSEEETQELESQDEEELALDMNWIIGEYLPEESNCREHFEEVMIRYIESLADVVRGAAPGTAVKSLSDMVYSITQKIHKLRPKQQNKSINAALEFVKALTKVLSIDQNVEPEVSTLRRNMLRLIGIGDFSDLAIWKDPCDTFILTEVICKACNHCRDIDLCKDKHRAMKDDTPVWMCAQCSVCYDTDEIEIRLLDTLQRKIMSYTLQDLRCIRCKQIKRENMAAFCTCAGAFETLISPKEVKQHLKTFLRISEQYKMEVLQETVSWMIDSV